MNNLSCAAVMLALSGLVFLAQRVLLLDLNANNQRLSEEAVAARTAVEEAAADLKDIENKLEEQRARVSSQHSDLAVEGAANGAIPLEPDNDGLWPTEKPYFYVQKKHLANAVFQWLAPDYHLHPNAAVVLGMTLGEAAAVDDGLHSVIEKFRALEVENLTPSSVHANDRFPGKKTSYRLPPLKDQMAPTVENFFASNRALLGDSRAEILGQWAKKCFVGSLGDFAPKARIFTLTDEDLKGNQRVTRFEVVEEGGKELHGSYLWDPPRNRDSRFPYRHLFGDNGEKRPGQPLSK